jgi:hypothetical protein
MILIRRALTPTLVLATAMLTACSAPFPSFEATHLLRNAPPKPTPETSWQDASTQPMPQIIRSAVKSLIEGIPDIYKAEAILVGTVVDANQVGASAALGRMLTEQIQAGMVASRYGVIELRLREDVAIRETAGELLLSRDVQELAETKGKPKTQSVALVVMGTYSAAETVTFVHLKAIRTKDGVIESTSEFTIPNDANVRKLLGRY